MRDHHPRDLLDKEEYENLRKKGCTKFRYQYKEEREIEAGEIIKPSKPEDKLMTYVKEKILRKLQKLWEISEKETNKRWDFEDKVHSNIVDFVFKRFGIFITFCVQFTNIPTTHVVCILFVFAVYLGET